MSPWAIPRSVMTRFNRKKKIWISCALANASTRMPGRLVIATPAKTLQAQSQTVGAVLGYLCHGQQMFTIQICYQNMYSRLPKTLLTALPILAVASAALSTCVDLVLSANDLVMCETNSTEMPTACKHTNRMRKKLKWEGLQKGDKGKAANYNVGIGRK